MISVYNSIYKNVISVVLLSSLVHHMGRHGSTIDINPVYKYFHDKKILALIAWHGFNLVRLLISDILQVFPKPLQNLPHFVSFLGLDDIGQNQGSNV